MNIRQLHPILHRYAAPEKEAGAGGGADSTPGAGGADDDQIDGQTRHLSGDERESVMDRITQSNRDREADELAAYNEANGIAPAPPAPSPSPAPSGSSEVDTQLEGGGRVMTDEELKEVRVKVVVDGKEEVITGLQAKADYQKQATTDKRLAEANVLLKKTRELAEAGAPGATPPPVGSDSAPAPSNTPATSTPKVDFEKDGKEFLSAVFEGDEVAGMAALQRLLGGRSGDGAIQTEAELLAKLTPKVKQQLAVESALDDFETEFSDIAADPVLAKLADDHFARIAKEDPNKDFATALSEAGEATRAWVREKAGAPAATPAPTTDRAKKLERKASAAPAVGGLRARASTNEPAPQTTSDTLAEMRAARGMEP